MYNIFDVPIFNRRYPCNFLSNSTDGADVDPEVTPADPVPQHIDRHFKEPRALSDNHKSYGRWTISLHPLPYTLFCLWEETTW